MSKSKKNNGLENTPDAILEEYRKMKSKTSQGSTGLSRKIMEISRAGVSLPWIYIDPSIFPEFCVLCDGSNDVCDPCDATDFFCSEGDGICVTSDQSD